MCTNNNGPYQEHQADALEEQNQLLFTYLLEMRQYCEEKLKNEVLIGERLRILGLGLDNQVSAMVYIGEQLEQYLEALGSEGVGPGVENVKEGLKNIGEKEILEAKEEGEIGGETLE
ncbi:hypothetical protein BU17DRAFT_68499 [Hysterangium stoloniferum]|nr:hypothetical protein BU17DRAFT_68499 [Hysterangium stoloniferum]